MALVELVDLQLAFHVAHRQVQTMIVHQTVALPKVVIDCDHYHKLKGYPVLEIVGLFIYKHIFILNQPHFTAGLTHMFHSVIKSPIIGNLVH